MSENQNDLKITNNKDEILKERKEREHKKTDVFLNFLSSLEKLDDIDRGSYTALKRAAGTIVGDSIPAMVAFYKVLPYSEQKNRLEPIYYLISTLYPLQPQKGRLSFGEAMRMLKIQMDSASVEKRFIDLIDTKINPEDLSKNYLNRELLREFSYRLRQCVMLLASKSIFFSWYDLLTDLYFFVSDYNDSKKIQKNWTRDFLKKSPDANT